MSEVTAIILAAGVGSRLRPLTDAVPKCLVPLGRETLLGRMVRLLAAHGAGELVVATGYREAQVREALASAPIPVRFAHCPDHATTQNVVSLHRALALVAPGRDVVKLDGDVAFDGALLARLFEAGGDAAALVDGGDVPPAEAMKVTARGGRITRFGKGLDAASAAGESIGVERFAAGAVPGLVAAIARAVEGGRTDVYYEDVYNDLLDAGLAMAPVSTEGLRWHEVDDADDLARARAAFAGE
ncbi:MAG: phosphocholine cytidylyltransferase family protein [Polyangiales bacterium]